MAETIERLTAGWSETGRGDAWRAAWYHDAWKCDPLDEMLTEIRAGGEEPDAWAVRHAPVLIHAQAAAVWARRTMGERNAEVLTAVRHHPTGHAEWGDLGRVLFVSDFCEPGRPFAESLGTARLVERAAESSTALAEVALEVLAIRLGRALAARRPIHPDGWHAWNGWTEAAGS